MSEQFYTILTKIGKAKIANAAALGTQVNLVKFQIGDGNGSYYNPSEEQTQLKNKVWEGNLSSVRIDDENPNWIVLETLIPGTDGGFMVREAAAVDDEGNLIAIGKYPETYKPIAGDGSIKDLIIKMIIEVSNTSTVTLKVDPTVILATKYDIERLENKIDNIQLVDTKVSITDPDNIFEGATNVNQVLTAHKTSIQQALQSGVDAKNGMVQAINSKITVPDVSVEDTWNTYIQRVKDIKEGRGNANVADVLSGKTFTNDSGQMQTGTMPNRGGAQTVTPGTANKVLNSGYYSGNITVAGDGDLKSSNILQGINLFGVTGTAPPPKRFASGTAPTSPSGGKLVVSGLTFKPRFVVYQNWYGDYQYGSSQSIAIGDVISENLVNTINYTGCQVPGSTVSDRDYNLGSNTSSQYYIVQGGFCIKADGQGGSNRRAKWFAFE